jgi:hypothetical protein
MSRFNSPLDDVRVASPCSADWDGMYGDERKRFCKECKLNVYNLSGMSREEAERLVTNSEGRLCIRFYRRPDGTIITQDCPAGWAKLKHRTRIYATAAFSMLMTLLTGLFFVSLFRRDAPSRQVMGELVPMSTPTPTPYPVMGNYVTMGAVSVKGEMSLGRIAANDHESFNKGKAKASASDRT